jgi:hypothetical protein
MNHVVIEDPSGAFWEGAVVDQGHAEPIRSRGGCTMPCDPALFVLAGFAGFAKRSWGGGWPLGGMEAKPHAPIAVFSPGESHPNVHWRARLIPESRTQTPEERAGTLRLATSPTYWSQTQCTLGSGVREMNMVEIAQLPNLGEHDTGWIVGGSARLYIPSPGFYGLGIYGMAAGMRLAWLAVTLTS